MKAFFLSIAVILALSVNVYAFPPTITTAGESGGVTCTACTATQYDWVHETSDEDDSDVTGNCASCVDTGWAGAGAGIINADFDASSYACGFSSDAIKITSDGATDNSYMQKTGLTDVDVLYVSFYVYLDDVSGLANTEYIQVLVILDDGTNEAIVRLINNAGSLDVVMNIDGGLHNVYTGGLSEDTCYRWDFRFDTTGAGATDVAQGRIYYWDAAAGWTLLQDWAGTTTEDWTMTDGFDEIRWGCDNCDVLDNGDIFVLDCLTADDDTAPYGE